MNCNPWFSFQYNLMQYETFRTELPNGNTTQITATNLSQYEENDSQNCSSVTHRADKQHIKT